MTSYQERITINPAQCGGGPCIRGMRIRVKDVLDLVVAKVPEEDILEDFPYLEAEDIRACLAFAAAEADHPILAAAWESNDGLRLRRDGIQHRQVGSGLYCQSCRQLLQSAH